jgi:hypothetical protein
MKKSHYNGLFLIKHTNIQETHKEFALINTHTTVMCAITLIQWVYMTLSLAKL